MLGFPQLLGFAYLASFLASLLLGLWAAICHPLSANNDAEQRSLALLKNGACRISLIAQISCSSLVRSKKLTRDNQL